MTQTHTEKRTYRAKLLQSVNSDLAERVRQRLTAFYPVDNRTSEETAVLQTLPERLWLVFRMLEIDRSVYPDFPFHAVLRYSIEFNHDELLASPIDHSTLTYPDRWEPSPYELESPDLQHKHILELATSMVGALFVAKESVWRTQSYIETHSDLQKIGIGSFLFGLMVQVRELLAPGDATVRIHHNITDTSEGSWTTRQVFSVNGTRINHTATGPRTFLIREE